MSAIGPAKTLSAVPAKPRSKASGAQVVGATLKYTILIVLTGTWLFPFYWMFTSAIKNDSQVYTIPPVLIPIPAYWNNFIDAWTLYNFNQYAINSVFRYCIPVTIFTLFSSSVVAYGFSRLKWPGRDFLFFLCLATIMIPWQVTIVPLFITYKNLGWINTYLPLIVPGLFGHPFFIFLLRQFFMGIPEDLSDAARMDGASEFGILMRVFIPLAVPALSVVALFRFLWAWNDYIGPLVFLNQQELYPLALGIATLRNNVSATGANALAYPYLMAVSTIVVLPVIILFFLAQRTFIEGISTTGVKI
jgi:ABC-type glycerol-3-phosphate transport system permease component